MPELARLAGYLTLLLNDLLLLRFNRRFEIIFRVFVLNRERRSVLVGEIER